MSLKSKYLHSPLFDWVFLIGAPLLAYGIAYFVSLGLIPNPRIRVGSNTGLFWDLAVLIVFTQSHLFIVIIRAYLNPKIFNRYKKRLILTPLILMSLLLSVDWILITVIVLNVFWDAYHSSLQTFGFARIYDARIGTPREQGRTQDFILSLFIYMGPIFGGAVLMDHVQSFQHFSKIGWYLLAGVPSIVDSHLVGIYVWVWGAGAAYGLYYLIWSWRQYRRGHAISIQKTALLIITAAVSLLAWGFNSFGMAFIITNFFHAWQYFAIVYISERGNLAQCFGVAGSRYWRLWALVLLLGIGFGFGVWSLYAISPMGGDRWAVALLACVATMHFYYDSFVWPAGEA